ncbi:hypothetical protein [Prosthecobacter sp.]
MLAFFGVLVASGLLMAAPPKARELGVLEDFDSASRGPFQQGFIESPRWSAEQRQSAREWSRMEVVAADGGGALRIQIHDARAFADGAKSFLRLAPYYPPEADAVRIRLKVVSGQVVLHIGGPTAYYGNSDVFTKPQTVKAANKPEWVEVVCNFNHPTWRNYRRSGFSTEAPRNYYNRWAQEPVGVFLSADAAAEVLIDRIDLVALGEGRPFAVFAPSQVRVLGKIADFEDGKYADVFNAYMSAAETEWFEESWRRTKPLRFEPMLLGVADTGIVGKKSLECRGRTAEEVHCTGVHARGAANANAIAISLSADAPAQRNTLLGAGPVVPVDFLVFVAPEGRPFPWQRLGPSAELRAHGGRGFDYQLTHRVIAADKDLHFAMYQARRYLKPGEWAKLVLPTADFTCIYGQGDMRERLLNHEPLRSAEVIAVAWLNPWCRQGRRDEAIVTRVDEMSFVQVPGPAQEHISFWQVPDVRRLLHRDEGRDGQRRRHVSLPGDE